MLKKLSLSVIIFVLGIGITGLSHAEDISAVGSTTIKPIMERISETFKKNPDINLHVDGGGSSKGVKDVGMGNSDIGMASRKIKDEEKQAYPDIVIHTIGYDGVGIIVNEKNSISAITKVQLKDIYTGKITNWSQLGGAANPIVLIAKAKGHSTLGLFLKYVGMKDEETLPGATRIKSNNGVIQKVANDRNAIGYVSIGGAQFQIEENEMPIRLLDLDGVEATIDNVTDSTYPLVRPLNLVTKGAPSGKLKNILRVFKKQIGKNIIFEEGFIPSN